MHPILELSVQYMKQLMTQSESIINPLQFPKTLNYYEVDW